MNRVWPAVLALGVLTGCGSEASAGDPLLQIAAPGQVTVAARDIPGVGQVLTDSQGHALYIFPPDARSRVSCTGACAGTWPPLAIAAGATPSAGSGGVESADLATLPDPNSGARIVTYGGYPLYRYAGDVDARTAAGQGLLLNGGPWYTLRPDLQPVTTNSGPG